MSDPVQYLPGADGGGAFQGTLVPLLFCGCTFFRCVKLAPGVRPGGDGVGKQHILGREHLVRHKNALGILESIEQICAN